MQQLVFITSRTFLLHVQLTKPTVTAASCLHYLFSISNKDLPMNIEHGSNGSVKLIFLAYPTRFSATFTSIRNSHLTRGGIRRLWSRELIHVHLHVSKDIWQCQDKICWYHFAHCYLFSKNAVYSEPMLFTKVKVPSLNVEPDQTMRMRLWSNFVRYCKYRFLCRGSGDICLCCG